MAFDLESLRLIWWAILGLVMIGFSLSEGLTLGVSMLLPILCKTAQEQQTLVRHIVPINLSNLAWMFVLVVVIFAAWPIAYAVALNAFYPLLFLILLAVLLRPLVLYFFGGQLNDPWHQTVKKVLAISGWGPAALLGLITGNMLKGIPFHLDSDMQMRFLGDFWSFFNLFSIVVALTCLALLAMHGAVFLQLRTRNELEQNARATVIRASGLFILLFAVSGLWITHLEGYHVTSEILPNDASNPLAKFVKRGEGLWLDNYEHVPALWIIPVLAFLSAATTLWFAKSHKTYWAMCSSALCVSMTVLTFGVSMFPFLLASNISLNSSLTVWDSSASPLNLQTLLWVAVFALPLMVICSRWLFSAFAEQSELVQPKLPE